MFSVNITAEQLEFMQSFLMTAKVSGAYNESQGENNQIDTWLTSLETATQVS
jgi:hypothetical protein